MCVFVCTHIGTLWIYLSMTIFCRTTSQAQITIKPIEMTEQQEQQQNWRGYPAAFTYVFRLILLLLLFLLLRWHYRRLVSVRSLSPSFSRSALCFSLSFEWRYTFFRYQIIFFVCVLFIAVLIWAVIWNVLWLTSCCCVHILDIEYRLASQLSHRCSRSDNDESKFRNTNCYTHTNSQTVWYLYGFIKPICHGPWLYAFGLMYHLFIYLNRGNERRYSPKSP